MLVLHFYRRGDPGSGKSFAADRLAICRKPSQSQVRPGTHIQALTNFWRLEFFIAEGQRLQSLTRHQNKTHHWKEQTKISKWTNGQSHAPQCGEGPWILKFAVFIRIRIADKRARLSLSPYRIPYKNWNCYTWWRFAILGGWLWKLDHLLILFALSLAYFMSYLSWKVSKASKCDKVYFPSESKQTKKQKWKHFVLTIHRVGNLHIIRS